MSRKTASHWVDSKPYGFAFIAQPPREFRNRLLCLRYRHAVARNDNNAVCIFERCCDAIRIDRDLLALGPVTTGLYLTSPHFPT